MLDTPPTLEYRHDVRQQLLLPWWMKLSAGLVLLGIAAGVYGTISQIIRTGRVDNEDVFFLCCTFSIAIAEWFAIRHHSIAMIVVVAMAHLLLGLLLVPGMLWVWEQTSSATHAFFGFVLLLLIANATCHLAFVVRIVRQRDSNIGQRGDETR